MTGKITNARALLCSAVQIKNERSTGLTLPVIMKEFSQSYRVGLANRRKLKTWVSLRLRLARPCVDLQWLALSLVEIKFARTWTQVFHRLATQHKSTQVEWRLLVNEIQVMFASCMYFWGNLPVRLATQHKSLWKYNLPLSTIPVALHQGRFTSTRLIVRLSKPIGELFPRFFVSVSFNFPQLMKQHSNKRQ